MTATSATKRKYEKPTWTNIVSQYHNPELSKSIWQIVNTFIPYMVLWYLMYRSLEVGYWLTFLVAIPTSLFMVRIFVLQHDCGHNSFFRSRKANNWVGMACSIFTFVPFYYWRRTHALHHAAAGDLDHRGVGDFYTMTVDEYAAKTKWEQFKYRLYRNPIVMFMIAPTVVFVVGYRFDFLKRKDWKRERKGLLWTNLGLLAVAVVMTLLIGLPSYLIVQLTIVFLGAGIGTWFFFVQHNYEDAYWASGDDWDYTTAALQGSSYYKLPRILQWFTGSIGFHHIHHLSPKIPNYNLEKAHNENEIFQTPVTLTLRTGFETTNLSLWDDENRKMINFRQYNAMKRAGQQDPTEKLPVEATVEAA